MQVFPSPKMEWKVKNYGFLSEICVEVLKNIVNMFTHVS